MILLHFPLFFSTSSIYEHTTAACVRTYTDLRFTYSSTINTNMHTGGKVGQGTDNSWDDNYRHPSNATAAVPAPYHAQACLPREIFRDARVAGCHNRLAVGWCRIEGQVIACYGHFFCRLSTHTKYNTDYGDQAGDYDKRYIKRKLRVTLNEPIP